ncbi:hypothetical protein D3C73_942180 [compost metagenome]
MGEEDYLKNFFTYLLSPVIAGIKPSSTITLTRGAKGLYNLWQSMGKNFLDEIGLKSINLREDEKSLVALVYNENALEDTLSQECNLNFLEDIGYCREDKIDDLLSGLISRYKEVHCPHELGIFLGIPLEDVKAFMECTRENCLMCGYWKVYGDKEKATRIFNHYDKSKDIAMKGIMKGVTLNNIIYDIRENWYM